jgi:hypothetical protein
MHNLQNEAIDTDQRSIASNTVISIRGQRSWSVPTQEQHLHHELFKGSVLDERTGGQVCELCPSCAWLCMPSSFDILNQSESSTRCNGALDACQAAAPWATLPHTRSATLTCGVLTSRCTTLARSGCLAWCAQRRHAAEVHHPSSHKRLHGVHVGVVGDAACEQQLQVKAKAKVKGK